MEESEDGDADEIDVDESDDSSLEALEGEACNLNSLGGYCIPSTKVKRRDFNVAERLAVLKVFAQTSQLQRPIK